MAKFTCNFISYTLKRTVDITVIIPTTTIPESMGLAGGKTPDPKGEIPNIMENSPACSHQKKDKYPVVYLLHGMGNNHAQWTGYTNVELFAEERNIAIVNMSAENKSYVNNGGDRFYDFVENELQDFVTGIFPISKRPEDTYIAGLSMGGFGTLVHCLGNPEKYHAFGAFSAAVELNPAALSGNKDEGINPEYDPNTLADRLIAVGSKIPAGYIACGGKDFLYKSNTAFYEKLKEAGADVTWDTIEQYGHEWRFWNIEVERFLDWLEAYRTDAYAGTKRQI